MKWQDLMIDGYGRVLELLEPALSGLTQADLTKQPRPDCNSIGWIVWHLARVQDAQIADLMGEGQVWIKGKWHTSFGRDADPRDTGFGHSADDVAVFKSPSGEVLLGYYRATLKQTEKYLSGLTLSALARELNEPWYNPRPTVGVRIVSIMADGLQHSGEVAYLRGLLKGKGWLGA